MDHCSHGTQRRIKIFFFSFFSPTGPPHLCASTREQLRRRMERTASLVCLFVRAMPVGMNGFDSCYLCVDSWGSRGDGVCVCVCGCAVRSNDSFKCQLKLKTAHPSNVPALSCVPRHQPSRDLSISSRKQVDKKVLSRAFSSFHHTTLVALVQRAPKERERERERRCHALQHPHT